MPTFSFSENELGKLVRFFEALSRQSFPYIPESETTLTAKETDMARSLFSSTAAPCLKCHATGDPAHDKNATAPNFLLARGRLKADWMERWIIDPQAISPGTAMPSGLVQARERSLGIFGSDSAFVSGLRQGSDPLAGELHFATYSGGAAPGRGSDGAQPGERQQGSSAHEAIGKQPEERTAQLRTTRARWAGEVSSGQ